jgi:hypothetical protein
MHCSRLSRNPIGDQGMNILLRALTAVPLLKYLR